MDSTPRHVIVITTFDGTLPRSQELEWMKPMMNEHASISRMSMVLNGQNARRYLSEPRRNSRKNWVTGRMGDQSGTPLEAYKTVLGVVPEHLTEMAGYW
jgi:hypothetical protein